ncbi:Putative transposase DNA-binding domain-containing protein, partial [Alkalithermobacter thermoalcaliphilus JW-YL-7 = DSM 7308]
ALNDIKFILADTFYPSSKTCSRCGALKNKLSLSERTFICDECGHEIDRDLNASINLKNYGKSIA